MMHIEEGLRKRAPAEIDVVRAIGFPYTWETIKCS